MGLTKYRLGELLELTEETNGEHLYGPDDVRGMTITKQIIPTKADVSATDLSKFLVIHPREFVFNPRTHGKHIGLGFNDSDDSFIISWNNIGFRIVPSVSHIVLPEYLFFHFNRTEWDREACFRSWGSSTEVFSWDALCEMQIDLPPLPIQQKYVAMYRAMVANQQSYERGLEDLRLVCDGFFDRAKKGRALPLGQLIERVDRRNVENLLGEKDVRGITNIKEFSATKADVSDVDLSKFKVVNPGEFAYNSRTDGRDMLVLALNRESGPVLVTFNYNVFRVRGIMAGVVHAEYLYAYFKRAEFDRRVRFCSWGSSQELLTWDNLCEISIPLPSIEEQTALSDIMLSYIQRRRINEQLKSKIRGICPILIKGSLEEAK